MPAGIIDIPTELVESIFQHLDVTDIYSLRLTCSALRFRTIGRFKSLFSHVQTDLTEKSLQKLIGISTHVSLAPAVQSLAITAVDYDSRVLARQLKSEQAIEFHVVMRPFTTTNEELTEVHATSSLFSQCNAELDRVRVAGLDASLLKIAFRNFTNHDVKLRTLSLEAALYQDRGMRLAARLGFMKLSHFNRADHVFSITMAALAESRLAITEHLQIFGGDWGCCVSANETRRSIERLQSGASKGGLPCALSNLKSLSLSFSYGMIDGKLDNRRDETADENLYSGPAWLLALAPQLEELDLLPHSMCYRDVPADPCFKPISRLRFAQLRKLALSHFSPDAAQLRQFLSQNHRLQTLELNDVELKNGSWRPIFDDLSSRDPPVERASFSRLYEGPSVEFGNDPTVQPAVLLQREQIREGIKYWLKLARFNGSPLLYIRRLEKFASPSFYF